MPLGGREKNQETRNEDQNQNKEDAEFLPLSPSIASQGVQDNTNNGRANAWHKKSTKIFMNSGVGGKLEFIKTDSDRVLLK